MYFLKRFDTETSEILRKEWDYIRDLPADENGFTNGAAGISWEDFLTDYVPARKRFMDGTNLKEGLVRQIDYFLWDSEKIAGMFRVRPELNDFLRTVDGGHIGYSIRREFRGKGYATEGLRLALSELKTLSADSEAYFFVRKDNPASLRVMLKNGGYIHHETDENFAVRIPLFEERNT